MKGTEIMDAIQEAWDTADEIHSSLTSKELAEVRYTLDCLRIFINSVQEEQKI